MRYEINDSTFGGHLTISDCLGVTGKSSPISCFSFVLNRGKDLTWEVNFQPTLIPSNSIFSLSPGQQIKTSNSIGNYIVLQFNREFYCVQDHDHEVSCNGILFNGALQAPVLELTKDERKSFEVLLEIIVEEFKYKDDVQLEMMRTVLKRFIIKCTRLAKQKFAGSLAAEDIDLVRHFNTLVEMHFRSLRKVSDYAELMNKSPKTISNVFSSLPGQSSPLHIIHGRVIQEAKRLLSYTDKTSKEISFDLNFSDPVQFNRLFKNFTGMTPGQFKSKGLGV